MNNAEITEYFRRKFGRDPSKYELATLRKEMEEEEYEEF